MGVASWTPLADRLLSPLFRSARRWGGPPSPWKPGALSAAAPDRATFVFCFRRESNIFLSTSVFPSPGLECKPDAPKNERWMRGGSWPRGGARGLPGDSFPPPPPPGPGPLRRGALREGTAASSGSGISWGRPAGPPGATARGSCGPKQRLEEEINYSPFVPPGRTGPSPTREGWASRLRDRTKGERCAPHPPVQPEHPGLGQPPRPPPARPPLERSHGGSQGRRSHPPVPVSRLLGHTAWHMERGTRGREAEAHRHLSPPTPVLGEAGGEEASPKSLSPRGLQGGLSSWSAAPDLTGQAAKDADEPTQALPAV
uniref:formin-like protein 14 n=1 Tax=Halichoerus grypus TaxID=9711 RepID=UPI0016599800|nr:formin-like protein 14 [Halichoerus grypus]